MQNTNEILRRAGIIPDVIPEDYEVRSTEESVKMNIMYTNIQATSGRILSTAVTQDPPMINLTAPPLPNSSYVLVMTDPDIRGGQYCHWIVADIAESNVTSRATEYTPYMGPAPPPGKYHRYTFLLFSRDKIGPFDMPPPAEQNRAGFNAMDWARSNSLRLLSADYFNCKAN